MIIKTDQDEIRKYLSDESGFKGYCDNVCFPENEQDILEVLKQCNRTKTKITISGNGTGLTSGRVPEGGVVLSMEKLNAIPEINESKKYVLTQPGVILNDLQNFVENKGLFYPPDPTERNCFIGAAVSTNSSGARTFKYGPTRDYVLGLRVILADGKILNLQRGQNIAAGFEAVLHTEDGKDIFFTLPDYEMPETKNAAGYYCKKNMDLIDLFIGSEGTLGIISGIKLKLIDLPGNIMSCVSFFKTEEDALNFIDEARSLSKHTLNKSNIDQSNLFSARGLEYFDNYSLRFLKENYPNIPETSKAGVWYEQEINDNEEEIITLWINLIKKHNSSEKLSWFAIDKNEQEKLKEFRHAIAVKVNEYMAGKGLKKIGTDVAVPDKYFRVYYSETKEKIEKSGLRYVNYGHFGNSHMHLNFLPSNQDEYIKARKLYKEICIDAIKLKGTFSAEHGVGKSKREYLLEMYGEDSVKKMAALKKVFDPNSILNIGNIFYEKYLKDL
jgi:D-lactate dehydrogenase (cytochrome)